MENNQLLDKSVNLPQPLLDVREVARILHISPNCYF
jgi:hypothetical protein